MPLQTYRPNFEQARCQPCICLNLDLYKALVKVCKSVSILNFKFLELFSVIRYRACIFFKHVSTLFKAVQLATELFVFSCLNTECLIIQLKCLTLQKRFDRSVQLLPYELSVLTTLLSIKLTY